MTAVTLQSVPLQLHEKQRSMASKGDAKDMPEGFAPSEFDVLVGWARQNFHHAGNRRFRDIISGHVPRYSQADSKISRGQIITDIVREIQSMSPSGTGFLKLNPYTARWNFIGTDKAKDKVGHALRKALMNAEGGENDDSSSKQDEEANGDDQRRRSNSDNNASSLSEKSAGSASPSSPHESIENSKKRPSSLPRKRKSPREPLVSILKKTGTSKYNGTSPNGDLRVETMAPGTSTNESELASKAFASPGTAPTTRMMRPDSTSDPHSFSVGLSPVARDMFDEKNEVMDQAALRKRARQQKKMNERHGYDTDDTDHNGHRPPGIPRHPSSSGSDSSYPEQRVVAAPYAPPAPSIPPPLHHPIVYGAGVHQPHPNAGTPFYYSPHLHHIGAQPPPHAIPPPPLPIPSQKQMQTIIMPNSRGNDSAMSRRVVEHQHQHPHYIHAGQGGLTIAPPQPTMVPGAPHGGVAMVPPPPAHMASTMYYPPGYYYYPGFMVPPPTDPGAAAVAASHHPHAYPPPPPSAIPCSYSAPGMMESSYYNQHDHYDHDDDESVNHHRSASSS